MNCPPEQQHRFFYGDRTNESTLPGHAKAMSRMSRNIMTRRTFVSLRQHVVKWNVDMHILVRDKFSWENTTYIYIYIYIYTYIYTYIYIYIFIHMYIYICLHIYIHFFLYIFVYIYQWFLLTFLFFDIWIFKSRIFIKYIEIFLNILSK